MKINPRRKLSRFCGKSALSTLTGGLSIALLFGALLSGFFGCSSSSSSSTDSLTGVFVDSPVAGLDYETPTLSGTTDDEGTFRYQDGETVTFSIGDLILGSAAGQDVITPVDIVEGTQGVGAPAVVNISRFLQSIDEDGDLNNGIRITSQTTSIISGYAGAIDFDQSSADFDQSQAVVDLMDDLNQAGVFTDLDPRPRTIRGAAAAREHLERSLRPRITVSTTYGDLRGYEPADNTDTWQWLGIPYATPPVGDLRWRPPQQPESWTGVREATDWGDQAAQNPAYQPYGEGGMSEDCLYLNITAPKDAEGLPVMVWLHGGGFRILTGNSKSYNNPASLPTKDVVLVTVNHRLGPFGYLAHPLLSEESGYGGSGNYGQMDLIAALEWVQENIEAFGGDSGNVTIFGESGGGGKVNYLLASPLAENLFHRAIAQSSRYISPELEISLAEAEALGDAMAAELGVSDEEDVLEAMRSKSWLEIEQAAAALPDGLPNVDGHYLPDTLRSIYEQGQQNDVPLMQGVTKDDSEFILETHRQEIGWLADSFDSDVFNYVFSHVPSGWAEEGVGAYHGIELVYVFNYPASFYSHYLLGLAGLTVDPTLTPAEVIASAGYSPQDVQLANDVMEIWARFAETGNPSVEGLVDWPAYTAQNDAYLDIDPDLEVWSGTSEAFARLGTFMDSPVAGLTYTTDTHSGTTDENGFFRYWPNESVTFFIGDLELGTAQADDILSPVDIIPGATGTDDPAVINMARLLQSLDQDGDLNNGIRITSAIADIVSGYAGNLVFGVTPEDFASDAAVLDLIDDLNDAEVFTDLDPRPRRLRDAADAREHLERNLRPRVTVSTSYGNLRGYSPVANPDTWQWLGVPYAKPPVGELRWRPPQKPVPWRYVRQATEWGDQAAQDPFYEPFGEGGMSEDSLYLNITAPRDAENLPVMVWFHGGGFRILTGNTRAFNNPASLPTKDVVLVSVNHRLGPFGYLAHPALSAETDYGGSGNYGQMDLVAALEWVRDNIAAFGGDPERVTIFGESGGGGKVYSLLGSPLAAGLFHGGIIQSGMSGPDSTTLADAEDMGVALAAALAVDNEPDVAAAMRQISWLDIEEAARDIVNARPNVDGRYMPQSMRDIVEGGTHNDVPVISGANTHDLPGFGPLLATQMPWMEEHFDSDVYAYVFSHVPSGWAEEGVGAYHGIELVYLFNNPASLYVHHALGLTGLPEGPPPPVGWSEEDEEVVDNIMTMWSNFARTNGNPDIPGVIDWEPYSAADDRYLDIGAVLEMSTDLENAFAE